MKRLSVGKVSRKAAAVGKSSQESALVKPEVGGIRLTTTVVDRKSANVGGNRHSSTGVGAACSECRRIFRDGHTYWNIKGCGDAARVSTAKFFSFRRKGCGDFCPKRGTNVPPHLLQRFSTLRQSKWEEIYGKTQNRTESAVSEQRIPRGGKEGVEGPGLPIRTGVHSRRLRTRDSQGR